MNKKGFSNKIKNVLAILMLLIAMVVTAVTGSRIISANAQSPNQATIAQVEGYESGSEAVSEGPEGGGESGIERNEGGSSIGEETSGGANALALNQTFDTVRNGARLVMNYDPTANAFVGTVQNTTNAQLTNVRVEVHLSNGTELGPTTPTNLAPGQVIDIVMPATAQPFNTWVPHAEVGSGEAGTEGGSESGGEVGGESGNESGFEAGGEGREAGGESSYEGGFEAGGEGPEGGRG